MSSYEDLVGSVFGQLTVTNVSSSTVMARYWDCTCACSKPFLNVKEEYLLDGKSLSCMECKAQGYLDRFLKEASEMYGDKYTYSIPQDFRMGKDITIKCRDHGVFKKIPTYFLQGDLGCKSCLSERRALQSLQAFKEKASKLYEGFYDYSKSSEGYQSTASKIDVICPRHGLFNIKAASHLDGYSCLKCSYHLSAEDFANKANKIHGTRYDYSLVEYEGSFTKVKILCKDHGVFEQTPSAHFQGTGCKNCTMEFRSYSFVDRYTNYPEQGSKKGFLYLMEVEGNGETFIKVGVSTEMRKRINSYRREENYTFTLIKSWTTTRLISAQVENTVMSWKRSEKLHYWPRKNFDGRSECMQIDYRDKVSSFVEGCLLEHGWTPER